MIGLKSFGDDRWRVREISLLCHTTSCNWLPQSLKMILKTFGDSNAEAFFSSLICI